MPYGIIDTSATLPKPLVYPYCHVNEEQSSFISIALLGLHVENGQT